MLYVSISFLFKGKNPEKLTGNLIIQTTNRNGISLKPVLSEIIKMNGKDVAMGLYEIDNSTLIELSKYPLKSIFVHINNVLIGSTVTENKLTLNNNLNCF